MDAPSIHFFFEKVSPVVKNRKKLKNFIRQFAKKEGKRLTSLNFIFCTDDALLQINKRYLNHNFYTDVIGFNLSGAPNDIIGDVYISVERVRENSKMLKTLFQTELHRVLFHGVLHLCGYSDKSRIQRQQMQNRENQLLRLYFNER